MTSGTSQAMERKEAVQKHCPKCHSARVHRSHRKNQFDRMMCAFRGEIRRCHDCRSRQIWFGPFAFMLPAEGMPGGFGSLLVLGLTFLVCFLFIWWMISRFTGLAG